MMRFQIEEMKKEDIPGVVAVHLASFEGFFLSILGPSFLRQLYLSILDDKYGIGLVALDGEEVVGFVAGTSRSSGVYGRLLRQRLIQFSLAAVPAILKKPSIVPRLLRSISDPHGEPTTDHNRGTLMSIAIKPTWQGMGVGKQLVTAFLERSLAAGILQVDLTTDKNNNESTNLFYNRLGFHLDNTLTTPEGREMNKYLITLD